MSGFDSLEMFSRSPAATERTGEALAAWMPPGTVAALYGELASGKTCFVRGMARREASGDFVHSPTFTLVNEYGGAGGVHHLDLYRLAGPDELADIGYEELFDGEGVCVIEWAERAEGVLPERRVAVHFEHAGGDSRRISVENRGVLAEGWREALRAACAG